MNRKLQLQERLQTHSAQFAQNLLMRRAYEARQVERKVHEDHGIVWMESPTDAKARIAFMPGTQEAITALRVLLQEWQRIDRPFNWEIATFPQSKDIQDIIGEYGLQQTINEPEMVLPVSLCQEKVQQDIETRTFERVQTEAQWYEWQRAQALSRFQDISPEKLVELQYLQPFSFAANDPSQLYQCRVQGMVVCTAQLFLHEKIAGVYAVQTIPDARRKGHGEHLMEYILTLAKERCFEYAVLSASDMGYPLYARMGFQEVGRYTRYEWHAKS